MLGVAGGVVEDVEDATLCSTTFHFVYRHTRLLWMGGVVENVEAQPYALLVFTHNHQHGFITNVFTMCTGTRSCCGGKRQKIGTV